MSGIPTVSGWNVAATKKSVQDKKTHGIHVWYIYLHLVVFNGTVEYGKCMYCKYSRYRWDGQQKTCFFSKLDQFFLVTWKYFRPPNPPLRHAAMKLS